VQAVNEVCSKQDAYLPQLRANIEKALGDDNSGPVAELDEKIATLQQELMEKTRSGGKEDYDVLGRELLRLREEKYQLQLEDANKEGLRQKIAEMEETFAEIGGEVTEYDENLVRKLIERVTVYDNHFTVEFRSGLETEVQL
jgi:hypothetical protein